MTYKVRNQFHEIEEIVHLPCGKINVELVGKGNSKFVLRQRFEMDSSIQVNLAALTVLYNNQQLSVKHHLAKSRQSGQQYVKIVSNDIWEASFQCEGGVFEGDTIEVFASEFLECEAETFSLDTLKFTFINVFRIEGVNNP